MFSFGSQVQEGIGEWQVRSLDFYPRSLALLFGNTDPHFIYI